MVRAYELLAERGDWPLHLGVTEAGPAFQGTIKSATAFGALLSQGIGDTIRVSLSAPPVEEVKVGIQILQSLNLRPRKLEIVSCPSCGRAQVDVYKLADEVTAGLEGMTVPLRVAVMGCVVNGPGEAREADLGVASGNGKGQIFVKGEVIKTVPETRSSRRSSRRPCASPRRWASRWTRSPPAPRRSPSAEPPTRMPSGRLDAVVPPPPAGRRAEVLAELAAHLVALRPGRRVVVALDGVDGAGKTVLGRELAALVAPHREVHRVSVDGFHRPRCAALRPGPDGRDLLPRPATTTTRSGARLVEPFRAGEPWVRAVHDVEREVVVDLAPEPAAGPDAVLVVDGIFLHRPELADLWDASVWVDVPFEVSVPRGNARFGEVGADEADPASAVNARYVGGQRLYLAEVDPAARATWVLDNTDLAAPVLTGSPGCRARAARPTASG